MSAEPCDQHPALAHHRDLVGEGEHPVDVVLDQDHRHLGGEAPDQADDALALGGGEAGERLVEQQDPGPGGQRHADLEQALAAVGELIDARRLEPLEAEELDQRAGLLGDPLVVVRGAPEIEAAGIGGLDAEADVLAHRKAREQVGDLERAGDAARDQAVGAGARRRARPAA